MKRLPFTGKSIRRILAGAKSETRRLIPAGGKPQRIVVGDVVAATEAYALLLPPAPRTLYRADWRSTGPSTWQRSVEGIEEWWAGKWTPARHMPARLARIHLRVLEVDARWLNDMTDADAVNEGCTGSPLLTPLEQFRAEWDEINRRRAPWASNPWVWRFSFERLTTTPRLPVRSRS